MIPVSNSEGAGAAMVRESAQPLEPAVSTAAGDAGSRPMRADARRNRQRVFDAARALFATPDGDPSMEQIARAAGVGVGTMYRNWPSRSALVEAIYQDDLAELRTLAERHHAEQEPWDALVSWLHDYVSHAHAKRQMLAELSAAFDARPELRTDSRRRVLDAATIVLDPARGAGAVRADVTEADLLQLVRGIVLPGVAPPERYAFLLEIVLAGIRTPPST
jgi:AcrR family transcriptional regulator